MALSIKDLRKGFPAQQKPATIKSFTIKEAPTLEPLTQVEGLQKYKADKFAEIEEADPQTGIDRIKETVKQKFDIDVDKRGKPFQVGEALKESKLTSDQKKELAKLLVEYETLKVEKSPAKQLETGFVKGFSPVSTTKLEESYLDDPTRYRESLNTVPATVGKVAGNMAKYASLYSLLGPAIAGTGGATAGGVGAATGTLAPTVGQQLGYTLGTGTLGAITGELAKDVTIGAGLGGIEALQEGQDVAKTVAQNILMDIGFNIGGAALGKGFKTIKEAIDKAKASKTPQLIEEVAKSLNVSPQEASKQIDNQIDIYVNQYGVADTKPFEQLQLEAPKGTEYRTDTTAINLRQPRKPDVYVNQFGVADTKPFEQLQLDAPKNIASDTSAIRFRDGVQPQYKGADYKGEMSLTERKWPTADLGNRKVKAFQFNNPEVQPFYREKAEELLFDATYAKRGGHKDGKILKDEFGDTVGREGNFRATTPQMARIRDETGYGYEDIKKALQDLIDDNGKENHALAKKIENVIDDMLVEGYVNVVGETIKPNIRYIQLRNRLDTTKIPIPELEGHKASQLNNQLRMGGLDESGQRNVFDSDMQRTDFDDFLDASMPTLKTEVPLQTKPKVELPQDFTIQKPQYPPLAKNFARETVAPKKPITPQLKPKKEIQVYRGFALSDDASARNLSKSQDIMDVIGKPKQEVDLLPLNYYTESPDIATKYADRDVDIVQSIQNRTGKTREEAIKSFETLYCKPPVMKGTVKPITISPNKVLDFSELGEEPTYDDVIKAILKAEGNEVPVWVIGNDNINSAKWDNWNRIEKQLMKNIPVESGSDTFPVYMLMKSKGTNDNTGRNFVNWLEKNGYDAVRYSEDGTKHYAVVDKPKQKPNLQDITIQKPTFPTVPKQFAKETPMTIKPNELNLKALSEETTDPVLKKFRLDLFGATPEKPIKAIVEGKPVNVVSVKNNVATLSDGTNVAVKNVAMPKTKIEPTLKPKEVVEPIDTRSKVLVDMPKKAKSSLFDTYDRIYQEVVSKNIPSERVGGKAQVQASNLNRASGAVEYNVFESQTNMNGKDIGKSVVEIFSDVHESKKAELFDYVLNYHNIDRYAEGKPVFGETITSDVSKKIVKDLESQNPKLAAKQKEITKYFKNIMDEWSVKSGLVSQETADLLAKMYPNYVPTYRAKDLPKNMSFGGQNVAQVLKKAKGGDSDILPIDQMMVAMTDRTIKNARKNELMNTWADIYQKGDNEMAQRYVKDIKFSDEKEVIEDILDVGKLLDSEPVVKGDSYVVNFYRDGKPAQMTVNKTLYESLKNTTSDDAINQVANVVKKYATDPMKATITGYNPLFTASNIMRDVPTALTFSSDPLNMSKQLPDAVKEMLTNGEKFRLFKAMGGTREGLIGSGGKFKVPSLKESKTVMDAVKKSNPIAKVGEMNNFVETLPRFTEFLNVLEKTGDPALAVYRSAELTTDFSRHGNLTKLVDNFVPYLNPSVQGIDKFFREMTKNPLKTIAKGATVITIPTMILDQVNKDNDAYNEMSPRERNLYFNIPFEDSKGNQKFIRIPKSRELGFVFSSLYEYAARLSRGQEVTGKEVAEAIKENFAPVDITSSTIFTPGIKAWNQIKNPDAYETNYFGSLIVPESQRNYSPGEQYDINSSGIAKAIGQQFNISPFVIDYLMNSYTGIVGQTLAPIGADKKSTIFTPFEKKFINDPVFKSNTITEFYEALDDATKSKNDFYRQNDLDSDRVAKYEKNKSGGTVELKKALELKKEASLLNSYSRELSDLRKEQKELKTSDDKNREELVRQIQIKMNELAKKALGEIK